MHFALVMPRLLAVSCVWPSTIIIIRPIASLGYRPLQACEKWVEYVGKGLGTRLSRAQKTGIQIP